MSKETKPNRGAEIKTANLATLPIDSGIVIVSDAFSDSKIEKDPAFVERTRRTIQDIFMDNTATKNMVELPDPITAIHESALELIDDDLNSEAISEEIKCFVRKLADNVNTFITEKYVVLRGRMRADGITLDRAIFGNEIKIIEHLTMDTIKNNPTIKDMVSNVKGDYDIQEQSFDQFKESSIESKLKYEIMKETWCQDYGCTPESFDELMKIALAKNMEDLENGKTESKYLAKNFMRIVKANLKVLKRFPNFEKGMIVYESEFLKKLFEKDRELEASCLEESKKSDKHFRNFEIANGIEKMWHTDLSKIDEIVDYRKGKSSGAKKLVKSKENGESFFDRKRRSKLTETLSINTEEDRESEKKGEEILSQGKKVDLSKFVKKKNVIVEEAPKTKGETNMSIKKVVRTTKPAVVAQPKVVEEANIVETKVVEEVKAPEVKVVEPVKVEPVVNVEEVKVEVVDAVKSQVDTLADMFKSIAANNNGKIDPNDPNTKVLADALKALMESGQEQYNKDNNITGKEAEKGILVRATEELLGVELSVPAEEVVTNPFAKVNNIPKDIPVVEEVVVPVAKVEEVKAPVVTPVHTVVETTYIESEDVVEETVIVEDENGVEETVIVEEPEVVDDEDKEALEYFKSLEEEYNTEEEQKEIEELESYDTTETAEFIKIKRTEPDMRILKDKKAIPSSYKRMAKYLESGADSRYLFLIDSNYPVVVKQAKSRVSIANALNLLKDITSNSIVDSYIKKEFINCVFDHLEFPFQEEVSFIDFIKCVSIADITHIVIIFLILNVGPDKEGRVLVDIDNLRCAKCDALTRLTKDITVDLIDEFGKIYNIKKALSLKEDFDNSGYSNIYEAYRNGDYGAVSEFTTNDDSGITITTLYSKPTFYKNNVIEASRDKVTFNIFVEDMKESPEIYTRLDTKKISAYNFVVNDMEGDFDKFNTYVESFYKENDYKVCIELFDRLKDNDVTLTEEEKVTASVHSLLIGISDTTENILATLEKNMLVCNYMDKLSIYTEDENGERVYIDEIELFNTFEAHLLLSELSADTFNSIVDMIKTHETDNQIANNLMLYDTDIANLVKVNLVSKVEYIASCKANGDIPAETEDNADEVSELTRAFSQKYDDAYAEILGGKCRCGSDTFIVEYTTLLFFSMSRRLGVMKGN